jgi:hypothetical protein
VLSTHGKRAGRTDGSLRDASGTPLVIKNGSNPKIGTMIPKSDVDATVDAKTLSFYTARLIQF